jgi:hypothetical protein
MSAMFLSLALITQTALSVYIPIFGQYGMRVGVSGIFAAMPAILFGPLYGAIVYGLSDVLGYLLKPTGAYLPLMTVIVAAGGLVRGILWLALCGRNNTNMRICVAAAAFIFLSLGMANTASLRTDGIDRHFYDQYAAERDGDALRFTDHAGNELALSEMRTASRLVITRSAGTASPADSLATYIIFMTAGLLGSAAFGFFLLLADWLLEKYFVKGKRPGRIMPLFLAMVIGGLFVTTLNTILLRETLFAASWKLLPFAVVWVPRVIETIISNTVYVYFVALLLGLLENQRNLKEWIK